MTNHGRGENEVQPLPLRTTARIALKGIRIRIWRSLLVIACIVLAIAFLAYILAADVQRGNLDDRASLELIERLARVGFDHEPSAHQRIQAWWMVGLAMLISLVGIVNAMLMSVSERFREIGTMKCLGALDRFVLELFLVESAVIGFAGTVAGVALGLGLAYAEGGWLFGGEVWRLLTVPEALRLAAACLGAGVVITILGALYPAYQAARMKPVVALRAEM